MLALELSDRVRARAVPAARGAVAALAVRGPHASPDVPADRANLAWRAAEGVLASARAAGRADGLALELALEKRIPSAAGLGGGSSDAAAAVLACERALGHALARGERRALLAALGSDCVFFAESYRSGVALCAGRGELVRPWPAPWSRKDGPRARTAASARRRWYVALLTPAVRCATAAVYAALGPRLSPHPTVPSLRAALLDRPIAQVRACLFNDLETAACRAFPELAVWREALDDAGAASFRLAGSGSSWFGIYATRASAVAALARVRAEIRQRGLALRGAYVTRPSGHGARLLP
jgi:4-diphosphocytidyl-2-C-methyl-D-erythritol kinase